MREKLIKRQMQPELFFSFTMTKLKNGRSVKPLQSVNLSTCQFHSILLCFYIKSQNISILFILFERITPISQACQKK